MCSDMSSPRSCIIRGLDLLDAIDIFGHADVQVMLDIYVELRKDSNDSREKIDEYLKTYLTF